MSSQAVIRLKEIQEYILYVLVELFTYVNKRKISTECQDFPLNDIYNIFLIFLIFALC